MAAARKVGKTTVIFGDGTTVTADNAIVIINDKGGSGNGVITSGNFTVPLLLSLMETFGKAMGSLVAAMVVAERDPARGKEMVKRQHKEHGFMGDMIFEEDKD